MGKGDQYMRPRFSVGLGLTNDIPKEKTPAGPETECPSCGAVAPSGRAHTRKGDEQATSKRICFGLKL